MTHEERRALKDASTPEITFLSANLYINWGWAGCGFGQLSVDFEDGKVLCDNECMSRESVRKILIAMANKMADEAILDCD